MNSSVVNKLGHAIKSHLGIELRDVQIEAANYLQSRSLVEMQTGEGKTLTIAVAANLLAIGGRRVMIATANDYLAQRDARWMKPVYDSLDLRVAATDPAGSPTQRKEAYQGDVVYGTVQQFAFDFLRDLRATRDDPNHAKLIPGLDALIIDEADSILIDEARTPLIIHAPEDAIDATMEACFRWAAEAAYDFEESTDFIAVEPSGAIALTEHGGAKLFRMPMPEQINALTITDIQHALERAIMLNQTMFRDHHYLVQDDRIAIVDEYTGRQSTDRTFAAGLHQALEAREQVALTPMSHPVARITVQEFVSKFRHLCGVTATAKEDQEELHRVYGFRVLTVPPYAPCQREILSPVVCSTQSEKRQQIVDEVQQMLDQHRAILIGTRTIEQSEAISAALNAGNIEHVVLNARHHQREAEIVAKAGLPRRVTVATNMAGRGTHIDLDRQVRDAGGLHVIVAEMNTAARIDAQLIGRCARQGDPGSAQIYLAPDDQIFRLAYQGQHVTNVSSGLLRRARAAQKRIQREHRSQRNRLTAHESSVANSLRKLGLDPYLDQPADW